jgi:hypothetical protein
VKKSGKDMSPAPMRDRMKGKTNLSTEGVASRTRNWDTGLNAHQGAPIAPYPGSAKSVKDAGRFNNSNSGMGASTSLGSAKGMPVGRPAGAAASYPGVAGGHGPKVKGGSTGKPLGVQMGGSSGPDKGPKTMKNRFAGKTRGK